MADILFVHTSSAVNGYLRIVNDRGSILSLRGPSIQDRLAADGSHKDLFHRVEVAYWDKDAKCAYSLPISSPEEILEAFARHLGYEVKPKSEAAQSQQVQR